MACLELAGVPQHAQHVQLAWDAKAAVHEAACMLPGLCQQLMTDLCSRVLLQCLEVL